MSSDPKTTVDSPSIPEPTKPIQAPESLKIPVKDIIIPKKWNRNKPTDMKGLISSIKQEGQLIPLLVRMLPDGKTELVDGRRRLMAMKELKIKEAKIAYDDGEEKKSYGRSLIANLQRLPHNPVEKAEAFRDLKADGWSQKDIALSCGVDSSSISQHVAIFELPGKMQRALRDEKMSIGHSRQLLRVNEEEDAIFQEKLFNKILDNHLPVTVAEEMTANYLEKKDLRIKKKAEAEKAKAKEAKSTDKGDSVTPPAPPEDKTKGGRKPEMTDYQDEALVNEMVMIPKEECSEWLASYEERRVRTKSPKKREYLRGFVEGLETACGLRGED